MALTLYHDTYAHTGDLSQPPDLVLLHGWGLHSLVWDAVMPALLEQFQVTVIDLPGLGRSPVPGGQYDLDYLVEHVLTVAPEKAVWIGWSLGGMVAMRIAAQFPERISALITVASTPQFVADANWPTALKPEMLQGFRNLLDEDWEGTLIRFLALQCKDSDSMRDDVRTLKDILYFHGLPAQKALRHGLEILRDVRLLDDLPRIQCPTLHVFGENDNLVPVTAAAAIRVNQPSAQTAIIRGASHVPFLSAPELFIAACREFFSGLGPI
ncbi:MAG TPA: pimeloyl-ACP methyl ester esterase BioH [Dongiaceae bacterium]|nr:pimeloyl-ACP methyl ester esterase BioH [Dongiaceae bacterium]